MGGIARTSTGYALFNLSGQAVCALVMLPATFCAGMTLPLITGALMRRGAGERAIGQVYAANTVGAIAGVLIAVHAGVPVLDLLDRSYSRRPVNPLHQGAYAFDRIDNTRAARYARDFLVRARPPAPKQVGTQPQKDLEVVKLRLLECRDPRELDVWLHGLLNVARALNPYLPAGEAEAVWARFVAAPCYRTVHEFQRNWIELFAAVAAREPARMAAHARALLESQTELSLDAREYLLTAGMAGHIAAREPQRAQELWQCHAKSMRGLDRPLFRLLYCHADAAGCAAAFARYKER